MIEDRKVDRWVKYLNIFDLIGITSVVATAFFFQFFMNELPCPLCLLQRICLLAIGFGFLLNIHYEVRPIHYALSLLAAVFTAFVALRQITLHIAPGDAGYGSALFGFHMYTWAFMLCVAAIVYISILLSVPRQYHLQRNKEKVSEVKNSKMRKFGHLVFAIYIVIIGTNIISTFIECGFQECPDNPVSYQLL
jgi:disulfide bond formation protein DsbB